MTSETENANSPDEAAPSHGEGGGTPPVAPVEASANIPAGQDLPIDEPVNPEGVEAEDVGVAPEGVLSEGIEPEDVEETAGTEELDEIGEPEDIGPVMPLMDISGQEEEIEFRWYILKVQVNREDTIREALARKVRIAGLEKYFGEIVVPTEDVAEYTKSGKRRIVKRKLYPGYIVVNMAVNDDTWFLVRDTAGIGDFTGSAGKPAPLPQNEVDKLLRAGKPAEEGKPGVRTAIPFKHGDHVRVKDGHFQNFEGHVETIDEANGRVTVMINIFGRSTPVELEHWQIENV